MIVVDSEDHKLLEERTLKFDLDKNILILYASETGNALNAAEQTAREALRRGYRTRVIATDEYPLEDLVNECLVLFLISTTGSGIEPRSMSELWRLLLRADLPNDLFDLLHFSVFGLGDTSYERFCWPAKKLNRRLLSLGGTEIYPRADGDDQHPLGIDGALEPWILGVFDGLEIGLSNYPLSSSLFAPRIRILENTYSPRDGFEKRSETPVPDDRVVTVERNERLTSPEWFQDVRHIELKLVDNDSVVFEPGDVAVIYPIVPDDIVESILMSLGWDNIADDLFRFMIAIDALSIPSYIPRQTTLRQLFSRYLDVTAVPRRSFFNMLRHFTKDEAETEKLTDFCSAEGADDLYNYCYQMRRTIYEVLQEFRSVHVTKDYIFDIFPLLRPRQFSIASSFLQYPKELHLCVAIVRYKTKLKAHRRGICTTYLASLRKGDTLRISIKKGFMSLPPDPSVPIICVGPGTGVAPLRALLQHRILSGAKENTLYFGCRSASNDHYYAEEWAKEVEAGNLRYRAVFSRDNETKKYVQDAMAEDIQILWNTIYRCGGYLYISGSSNKMPSAVKLVIKEAAKQVGEKSEDEAKEYINFLERSGRLIEDCWS